VPRKKAQPGQFVKTREPGVYRRGNTYVARVYDPDTRTHNTHTAATFDQARDLKREAERDKRNRKRVGRKNLTVREWAGPDGRWYELFPRRRESTNMHNAERMSQYVRDFGDRLLPGVTHDEAHEWAAKHPSQVKVVKACLNDARTKMRFFDENPFDGIDKGSTRGRKDILVLTEPELKLLVATAHRVHGDFGEQVLGPMIEFMAGTGVRPGELYALTAADIDREEGEVHVWQQFNGRTRKLAPLKGTRQDRTVVMHDIALAAIDRLEPDLVRELVPKAGPLWRSVRGGRFKHREMTHFWPAVRAAFVAQLPESHHLQRRFREEIPGGAFDPYELRHFFGTALARAGASMHEIMHQMGHEDSETTKVYLHITNDDVRGSLKRRLRRAA
jgi:integrase